MSVQGILWKVSIQKAKKIRNVMMCGVQREHHKHQKEQKKRKTQKNSVHLRPRFIPTCDSHGSNGSHEHGMDEKGVEGVEGVKGVEVVER